MQAIRMIRRIALALCLFVPLSFAQSQDGRDLSRSASELVAKIVGTNTSFTAAGHLTIRRDPNRQLDLEITYALLDGKLRCEVNDSSTKDCLTSPEIRAEMKRLRMDSAVSICRPDRDVAYAVYPRLKAYCEIHQPTGAPGKDAEHRAPTVVKTEIGKETINSHACVKYQVIATLENGDKIEGTNWEATDLKGFPVRVVVPLGADTATMVFRRVNLHRPAATLFEPPASYRRFTNPDELIAWVQQSIVTPPK